MTNVIANNLRRHGPFRPHRLPMDENDPEEMAEIHVSRENLYRRLSRRNQIYLGRPERSKSNSGRTTYEKTSIDDLNKLVEIVPWEDFVYKLHDAYFQE